MNAGISLARSPVRNPVWTSVRNSIWSTVRSVVRSLVRSPCRNPIMSPVNTLVRCSVRVRLVVHAVQSLVTRNNRVTDINQPHDLYANHLHSHRNAATVASWVWCGSAPVCPAVFLSCPVTVDSVRCPSVSVAPES